MNIPIKTRLEYAQDIYLKRQANFISKTGTTRKIVLYREGKVAKDTEERHWADVIYNIPIPPYYFNKQSLMLFCYSNGHANVMIPCVVLESKLKAKGIKSNGYKDEPGLSLMNVFVCHKEDYLVILSRTPSGTKMVKAASLLHRKPHTNMHAAGNVFVKDATPYKWMVIPKELKHILQPIICHNSGPGTELAKYPYASLLEEIEIFADTLEPSPIIRKFRQ